MMLLSPRRALARLTTFIALVSVLVSGCSSFGSSEPPTPTPIPTPVVAIKPIYQVQRGQVVKELEFAGRIAPVQEESLFFRTNGFVRQINVSRGAAVTAGQVLAQLDVTDLENQLNQARLALTTSEAQLEAAQHTISETLTEAQIALDTAKLRLAQTAAQDYEAPVIIAQINVTRTLDTLKEAQEDMQKSLERSWDKEETRKAYARKLELAQQNITIALAQYDQAASNRTSHDYAVQILAQDVKLAQLRVDKLKRGVDEQTAQAVEMARLTVKRLEDQLANTRLVAPFDGQVTFIQGSAGSSATAFNTIMIVADPSRLEVSADVSAVADAIYLSPGMTVTVEPVSQAGQVQLQGTIRRLPDLTTTERADAKDRTVRITLEGLTPEVGAAINNAARRGLDLDRAVRIKTAIERKDNVLWLPPQAVRIFEGRRFVVVIEGAVMRRVDVKLGLVGKDRVEIAEGLTEGQTVQSP